MEYFRTRLPLYSGRDALIFLFALVLALGSVSCSPARRIDMKNQSGGEVEIKWKLKELDSLHNSDFFISNSDELEFKLKPQKPLNEVNMTFGMGSWKPAYLASVTERLESLTITSGKGKLELTSSQAIYDYLLSRRKGIGKRKIVIEVKE